MVSLQRSFPFSLARSRALKFPLPLLRPATQANALMKVTRNKILGISKKEQNHSIKSFGFLLHRLARVCSLHLIQCQVQSKDRLTMIMNNDSKVLDDDSDVEVEI